MEAWESWGMHVLKELERLNGCYSSLDEKVNNIEREITMLKVKSGLWGAAAGAIPVLAGLLILLLRDFI